MARDAQRLRDLVQGQPFRGEPQYLGFARGKRHAFIRLAATYWAHDGHLDPPVLDRIRDRAAEGAFDGIPAILIHGRRDVSGPAVTAWDVHRAWPGSRLEIVEDEGHGGERMVGRWAAAAEELVTRAERDGGA